MLFPFLVAMWAIAFAIRSNNQPSGGRIVEVNVNRRRIDTNNEGIRLLKSNQYEESLEHFEEATRLRLPSALAKLIWVNTLLDRHHAAVQAFEDYAAYVDFDPVQTPRIKSNAALSIYALGNHEKATKIWQTLVKQHHEAPLFLRVAAYRDGKRLEHTPPISRGKMHEMQRDCAHALKSSRGWARQWFKDCQKVLKEQVMNS